MKDEDKGDLIETAQEMVDQNHPMVKAWQDYKAISAYRNSHHWAAQAEHVDGSLWAAFVEGWAAAERQIGEGVMIIALERQRQVTEEGWTPEHDDQHKHGEMCAAAAVYAFTPKQRFLVHASQFWPWDMKWFKPGNRIRELAKAGALIAAEIDRLKRRETL